MLRTVSLISLLAVPITAQAPVTADSGALIRMHTATGPVVGRLTTGLRAGDTVVRFCTYPGPPCGMRGGEAGLRSLVLADVTKIDISRGTKSGSGAAFAGIIGALVGGGFGSFGAAMCGCRSQTSGIVTGGFVVGLTFAGIGALIGSGFPRW